MSEKRSRIREVFTDETLQRSSDHTGHQFDPPRFCSFAKNDRDSFIGNTGQRTRTD